MTTTTALSINEPVGVIASMAATYNMVPEAFERTLMSTIMPSNVTREQVAAFLLVAREHGLNPFTKEIFAFPSRGGIQPVVSVDGWLKLMNAHPAFDGLTFKDTFDDKGKLASVTAAVFRKDRAHPIEVTEYMAECVRDTDVWKRWPMRMLRHKAAIQAARYAFGFAGIMEPDEYERMQEVAKLVPPAQLTDDRKRRHDEAFEQYEASVMAIKAAIEKEDYYTAAEVWAGIPSAAQMDLWVAPTKGGCFTTHERDVIKNKLPRDESPIDNNGDILA